MKQEGGPLGFTAKGEHFGWKSLPVSKATTVRSEAKEHAREHLLASSVVLTNHKECNYSLVSFRKGAAEFQRENFVARLITLQVLFWNFYLGVSRS